MIDSQVSQPFCKSQLCSLNRGFSKIGVSLVYSKKREDLLNAYREKQSFRVAVGKGKWKDYATFNPAYNLREILKDEVVIEFDTTQYEKDQNKEWNEMSQVEHQQFYNLAWKGINFTGINLYRAGLCFEIWEHGGKSPHLHIHDLPIAHLDKDKLKAFKRVFIKKYVPEEYYPYADDSLTGIHLIALEWSRHWKGCYGIKRLLHKFNPKEENIK